MEILCDKLARRGISYVLTSKNTLNLVFHNIVAVNFQNKVNKIIVPLRIVLVKTKDRKKTIKYQAIKMGPNRQNITFTCPIDLILWYENYLVEGDKSHSSGSLIELDDVSNESDNPDSENQEY